MIYLIFFILKKLWIPAFAGMTALEYLIAGVIIIYFDKQAIQE